jgi:hypothetical protein
LQAKTSGFPFSTLDKMPMFKPTVETLSRFALGPQHKLSFDDDKIVAITSPWLESLPIADYIGAD